MISLLILTTSLADAHAVLPTNYDCQVQVIAADLPGGSKEFKYVAPAKSDSTHGGDDNNFSFLGHKLTSISNSKWLGLTWEKNGVRLAQSVTVRSEDNEKSQVLILYNPVDSGEQASLICAAQPK